MKLLPLAGLTGAAVLSTIAITDALWQGFTNGTPPPWASDTGGHRWMETGMNLAHAVPYLLLAAVLVAIGPRLDRGGFVRWVRRLLVLVLLLFAALMIWGVATGATPASSEVLENGATMLFFALLLLPVLLGFGLLRRRALLLPAILLAGSAVGVIAAFALGGITAFAHPAYAEAMAAFGIALLPFALRDEEVNTAGASESLGVPGRQPATESAGSRQG